MLGHACAGRTWVRRRAPACSCVRDGQEHVRVPMGWLTEASPCVWGHVPFWMRCVFRCVGVYPTCTHAGRGCCTLPFHACVFAPLHGCLLCCPSTDLRSQIHCKRTDGPGRACPSSALPVHPCPSILGFVRAGRDGSMMSFLSSARCLPGPIPGPAHHHWAPPLLPGAGGGAADPPGQHRCLELHLSSPGGHRLRQLPRECTHGSPRASASGCVGWLCKL